MKMALGRGLEALIPEKGLDVLNIDIKKIVPNAQQPRKSFKNSTLKELAQSIKARGIIQPIVVTKNSDGTYSLVAGERRWRAASLIGLEKVPAIIKKTNEKDSLEIALIENIQRDDLNPLEMGAAFDHLLNVSALTQEELSDRVGKDRATIANYIRLLRLPEQVKKLIRDDKISMGHAKALLAAENKQKQVELARAIVRKGLSVRETEGLVRAKTKKKTLVRKSSPDPYVKDVEDRLRQSLGTKVKVIQKGKKGKIEIEYYSIDEFQRLLDILL